MLISTEKYVTHTHTQTEFNRHLKQKEYFPYFVLVNFAQVPENKSL